MLPAGLLAYFGGAVATVGTGVVVGLAVAAPAAAEDSAHESGHRATIGHTSPADDGATRHNHRGAGVPRAAAAESGPSNAGPSGAGPSGAGPSGAGPSGAVVATRIVRSAAALSAPMSAKADRQGDSGPVRQATPVTLPAVATTAVTIAPPDPAAETPMPMANPAPARAASPERLHNFYLDPRGQRVTFLKNTHFAVPGSWGLFIKKVYGTGTFTADSAYDLKDADQKDWNKFSGIAYTPLQPDKNSAMVGWRYNLDTREFEIAPFYNVNKERILPDEQTEVISIPADVTFHYNVDYSGITLNYGGKTVFKPYPSGLTPNVWTAARVSGWFGGNEAAPRTLSYYLSFNWW